MRRAVAVLFLVAFCGFASAQAERTHDITPADYFSVNVVTELAVSPDGKHVAFALGTWDAKADNRRTNLWVVPADGKGKPVQLTSDRANDRHPKWSGDGKSIFFVGNRKKDGQKKAPYNGTSQIWKVPADGGKVASVLPVEGGVTGFDYAPKADAVFYTADAKATDDDDFSGLRAKFKADYGHGTRTVSELYALNLTDGKPRRVFADKRYVREFAATAKGDKVAMITAPDDTVIRSEGDSRVDVLDVASGAVATTDQGWTKTAGSPWPWLESLAWNPSGTKLAYCTIFDAHPAEVVVCAEAGDKWPAARLARPKHIQVRGYGTPIGWADDATLHCLHESRGTVRVVSYSRNLTHYVPLGREEGVVGAFASTPKGVFVVRGTADRFPEIESLPDDPKTPATPITDLNPHTKSWKLPSVRHVTWKAPDGTEVGGVLELPHGYKKGDRMPLVVGMHGGPTSATHADLSFDVHNGRLYFAAKGYAVLFPNYRGSTGYGDKFLTDLIGNENDVEVKDILAGIQHLIKEGVADPDRVGLMGWSNGGYLTNCLITLKDSPIKFKAASSGAGILDTVAEWGFNDEPAYPRVLKKGNPWETPDVYRKTSPTYGLGNVTTPTLIHVGGNDVRCPPGHSRMLYRALKEYVKVPTELVEYPNEPHGLGRYSHRLAKMEWDLAWFNKYMTAK